jgi:hypothetical protein
MRNQDACNRVRPSQLRRVSPYNGYNFGAKDTPSGWNASNAAIFYPKRTHPKYYYAITNMRNSVDYVKNQENFEYDFKKHLGETGKSRVGNMVVREFDDEVEQFGTQPKKSVRWNYNNMK